MDTTLMPAAAIARPVAPPLGAVTTTPPSSSPQGTGVPSARTRRDSSYAPDVRHASALVPSLSAGLLGNGALELDAPKDDATGLPPRGAPV